MTMARGYLSQVGLDFESTFGADPGVPDVKSMPINSFDVKSTRAKNSAQTITGNRNPVMPFDGNVTANGSAVVPVDAVAFGWWLKAMFGAPTTSGAGPYVHIFKPGTTQPSLVLEKKIATSTATYGKLNGGKIGKFSMKVGGDGELTATLDIEAAKETIGTSPLDATPTTVSLARFNNFHATLKEGGNDLANCTDFNFDVNFNLDTSVYTIGAAGTRGDIPEGILAVTGSMTILFENTTLLTKALNSTETNLEVKFANGSNNLVFSFPEVQLQHNTPTIAGPQGVKLDLPWVAYYDNGADSTSIKATLTTTQATY